MYSLHADMALLVDDKQVPEGKNARPPSTAITGYRLRVQVGRSEGAPITHSHRVPFASMAS